MKYIYIWNIYSIRIATGVIPQKYESKSVNFYHRFFNLQRMISNYELGVAFPHSKTAFMR